MANPANIEVKAKQVEEIRDRGFLLASQNNNKFHQPYY